MGLGTGVPAFEPTLFVLPQERAECGLCACMPALPKDPWGEDTPEPPGKVRVVGRKGRDTLWTLAYMLLRTAAAAAAAGAPHLSGGAAGRAPCRHSYLAPRASPP